MGIGALDGDKKGGQKGDGGKKGGKADKGDGGKKGDGEKGKGDVKQGYSHFPPFNGYCSQCGRFGHKKVWCSLRYHGGRR